MLPEHEKSNFDFKIFGSHIWLAVHPEDRPFVQLFPVSILQS